MLIFSYLGYPNYLLKKFPPQVLYLIREKQMKKIMLILVTFFYSNFLNAITPNILELDSNTLIIECIDDIKLSSKSKSIK